MFVVLWEFEVKPEHTERFEKVYGPGGAWNSLFRAHAGHAETRLFRDTTRSGVYLTADFWLSRESYEEFLTARRSDYLTLDAAMEKMTHRERKIGAFPMSE